MNCKRLSETLNSNFTGNRNINSKISWTYHTFLCILSISGDTVGLDCSVFESSLPVVLFSKNYHPIGLRYLMANDPSQYFPTIALCGNGYEVVVDVFWHTRLCVGPTFEIVSLCIN